MHAARNTRSLTQFFTSTCDSHRGGVDGPTEMQRVVARVRACMDDYITLLWFEEVTFARFAYTWATLTSSGSGFTEQATRETGPGRRVSFKKYTYTHLKFKLKFVFIYFLK